MTSFLKPLSLRRPQLLILVLVLGAGLLPKNSMAEEGAGAAAAVKCYKTRPLCYKINDKTDDCLKPPTETEDCPIGYCFQYINYVTSEGKPYHAVVERGCASYGEVACLQKEPGGCLKLRVDAEHEKKYENWDKRKTYENCVKNTTAPNMGRSEDNSGGKTPDVVIDITVTKAKEVVSNVEYCACSDKEALRDRKTCPDWALPKLAPALNDTTTPTSTGVKHLGYNVVLGGALLVAVFPLRTMFLAG